MVTELETTTAVGATSRATLDENFVEVTDLGVTFDTGTGFLEKRAEIVAVDGVSFRIARGRTLGLVGGTGSGKSTVAHVIMGMTPPTKGSVIIDGLRVGAVSGRDRARLQRLVQVVLQDPYSSLDPRLKVKDIIAEPLSLGLGARWSRDRTAIRARVLELLGLVGLRENRAERYPHQLVP